MTQPKHTPAVANWLAKNEGAPVLATAEFPLFSDAWFIGEMAAGPYSFINTIARPIQPRVTMGIVLRYAIHSNAEYPDFNKPDSERYHGGEPPEELAAFASLILGCRLRAGRMIRQFDVGGDPMGRPIELREQVQPSFFPRSAYHLPAAQGERSLADLKMLESLLTLPTRTVIALLRAARLYQDSLWLAETEPELAWLLLVSALEAAANDWNRRRGDSLLRLMESKPNLYSDLIAHPDTSLLKRIADEFADSLGVTKKFVDFCLSFAKAPPQNRPTGGAQFDWIESNLRDSLRQIYHYRSDALHSGKPFPAPMCDSPYALELTGGVASERILGLGIQQRGSVWLACELPMTLHLFEHIARTAILGWWRSLLPRL